MMQNFYRRPVLAMCLALQTLVIVPALAQSDDQDSDTQNQKQNQSQRQSRAQNQIQDLWQAPEAGDTIKSTGKVEDPAYLPSKAKAPSTKDYDDIASDDYENARTLCLKAEQCMRQGATARAIRHLENALHKDPKDPDVHELYATALETRMKKQGFCDVKTFDRCVLEWTRMYRGEIGEEKGLTIKGVGLGAGMFSHDERAQLAKGHLLKVVGFLPKAWETNDKYVKRAEESLHKRSAQ